MPNDEEKFDGANNQEPNPKKRRFPFRVKFLLPKEETQNSQEINIETKNEKSPESKFRQIIQRDFTYPHFGKWIAWTLSIIIVLTSNGILIYKGLKTEQVQGCLWIGISILSLVLLFLVFQPIILVILAAFISYTYDFHREIFYKEMNADSFRNPQNSEKAQEVKEYRLNNVTSYMPTPSKINNTKRIELYKQEKRRCIFSDIATTLIIIILLLITISDHSNLAIFLRRTIINLAIDGHYTKSKSMRGVTSYEQFQEYLRETLIPALLTNSSNLEKPEPPDDANNGYLLTEIHDRGWTRDLQIKLIGQPRILQKRVTARKCDVPMARQESCQSELNLFNHDNENYGVGWEPLLDGEDAVNHAELKAWAYENWDQIQDVLWFGRLANCFSYGFGGYFTFLARDEINGMITYNFMEYFKWIDYRTRAIFIDFVVYAPGSNLFSMTTIAFEVSATGIFVPSFRINSGQLLDKHPLNYAVTFGKLAILYICIGLLVQKAISRCSKVGYNAYKNSGWDIVNAVQALIGIPSIITSTLSIIYESKLLDELDSAADDQFINFQMTFFWQHARIYSIAFLVSLEIIKIIRLLRLLLPYYQFEKILTKSLNSLIGLSLIIFLVCLSYSIILYIFLGTIEERFYSIPATITATVGYTMGVHNKLDPAISNNKPEIVEGIVFLLFLLITCYIVFGFMPVILATHVAAIHHDQGDHIVSLKPEFQDTGVYLDVYRLQNMKQVVLEIVTRKNYAEDAALSVVALTLSGRDQQHGSKKFDIVRKFHKGSITKARESQMKQLIVKILKEQ